ncbi:hypothetical protein CAL14_08360 [Bordetella genomosp. 9]|uniref:hypothetical protein n=1 Tax=Bordetella genomosp. 9 TaxID=1416803 RepID=UPI000A293C08|nr:hypothetical protein [Bordetella genomosp. 9]ARP90296.1 hypothetical protein CAL14_08360 [Bordetella genomosp. 9]
MTEQHPDAARIDQLGGPTKVAERLGIAAESGAVQRVSNWKKRGIPAAVKLKHEWLRREATSHQEAANATGRVGNG